MLHVVNIRLRQYNAILDVYFDTAWIKAVEHIDQGTCYSGKSSCFSRFFILSFKFTHINGVESLSPLMHFPLSDGGASRAVNNLLMTS